jgi:tetratricopeptide (TPR) repeat protein
VHRSAAFVAALAASWLLDGAAASARPRPPEVDPQAQAARVHLAAGIAYFSEGRFEEALHEMESAHRLAPVADLEYNLGQCLERLGRFADAAAAYRRYLDGKRDADDRKEVEAEIARLAESAPAADPSKPPPAEAAPPKPPPPPQHEVVFKTIVVYRLPPPPPGRGARISALALVVLSAGALACGIATAVLAQQAADQVTAGATVGQPVVFDGALRDAESRSDTYRVIAYVTFGVAALAAAGSLGLFFYGRKIDREAPKLALSPAAAPGFAGLALAGRF